ncbi:MAG: hypothetical protein SNG55_05225, partial [Rikenellaceae bacterium]
SLNREQKYVRIASFIIVFKNCVYLAVICVYLAEIAYWKSPKQHSTFATEEKTVTLVSINKNKYQQVKYALRIALLFAKSKWQGMSGAAQKCRCRTKPCHINGEKSPPKSSFFERNLQSQIQYD